MLLNVSDFGSRTILKLLSNTMFIASPSNLRNILQSLLMLYYIITLSKSLYFVSIIQKKI